MKTAIQKILSGRLVPTPMILLLIMAGAVSGAPPHPGLILRAAAGDTRLPYYLTHYEELKAKGVNSPSTRHLQAAKSTHSGHAMAPGIVGQFRALAILVDFEDNQAAVDGEFFDSLVFGSVGGTVSEYYREVSYDKVQLISVDLPSEIGWQRAPMTYDYYVNNRNGTGTYPQNTQKLVEDIIDMVDPLVDFSDYDNDGDGEVDGLMIIHAGRGAEYGGGSDVIWSHKWSISPRYRDGVYLSSYTIQPEFLSSPGDQTIGVIAHELGHVFGVPDLYDTDYSSNGVGKWGLMSFGSWLGPQNRGGSPAHLCAWCKMELGWLIPVEVTEDVVSQTIENVEQNNTAFKLWTSGSPGNEYFLIVNRQRIGFDSYLPNTGLLIWHIDENKNSNSGEWYPGLATSSHYLVALEQADGLYELERKNDHGDAGDPFPGTFSKTSFNSATIPSTDAYSGTESPISVENISVINGIAYADLIAGYSNDDSPDDGDNEPLPVRPTLAQNYPNPFNPTTTISFSTAVAAHAVVEVYNSLGQRVAKVLDSKVPVGVTSVVFDGTTDSGRQLASGVYYYRIEVGDFEESKKMVLVR